MSKWTYNRYRATLLRDGKFFALVTPDGRDRLSDQDASDLLAELNAEKVPRSTPAPCLAYTTDKDGEVKLTLT